MSETNKKTVAESMIQHVGTKMVKRSAVPMTKKEYCEYRGWKVPVGEDPEELVYLVEYQADERNKPNHQDHKGYISMSPKYVFDESYHVCETFKDRLVIEGQDLALKVEKLQEALMGNKVPESEIMILNAQLSAMTTYLNILAVRMENLK